MHQKPFVDYFLNGFYLANRALILFFISLFLSLPALFESFIPGSNFISMLTLVTFVLVYVHFGFSMSLPVFLETKQRGDSWNYGDIIKVTLVNTKRLLLPITLAVVLLYVFLIFTLSLATYIYTLYFHIPSELGVTIARSLLNGWQSSLLITIILVPFAFTSFIFSLEHKGIISSAWESIIQTTKNFRYVLIIFLIQALSSTSITFAPFPAPFGPTIRIALGNYVGLWLAASSLLYYQQVIKKGS